MALGRAGVGAQAEDMIRRAAAVRVAHKSKDDVPKRLAMSQHLCNHFGATWRRRDKQAEVEG